MNEIMLGFFCLLAGCIYLAIGVLVINKGCSSIERAIKTLMSFTLIFIGALAIFFNATFSQLSLPFTIFMAAFAANSINSYIQKYERN